MPIKTLLSIACLCLQAGGTLSQSVSIRLQQAFTRFQQDEQMKHAALSLYVVNSRTGTVVFDRNGQLGLPPASTQKVITSAAAFELLGASYRYKTELAALSTQNGIVRGGLHIIGSGDPTLGSWRWHTTRDSIVLRKWLADIRKKGITTIEGGLTYNRHDYSLQIIPDGWIWQDVGNYYGAGSDVVNWRENQYDLTLTSPPAIGGKVAVRPATADGNKLSFSNEITAAARGTGDNAYIYLPVGGAPGLLKGTIPAGEQAFTISGAIPRPADHAAEILRTFLVKQGILFTSDSFRTIGKNETLERISLHESPTLDSINFWFLKKSVNLYGESFVRAIAHAKTGFGSTEQGVELVRDFWSQHGIAKAALRMVDGSGLSPQNRVTTAALVQVMQFARNRPWFRSFFDALPEYNGIKMKSGTIGGTKSFTGYVRSAQGTEYTFAIIAHNYDGSTSAVVRRMYALLDLLK